MITGDSSSFTFNPANECANEFLLLLGYVDEFSRCTVLLMSQLVVLNSKTEMRNSQDEAPALCNTLAKNSNASLSEELGIKKSQVTYHHFSRVSSSI